MQQVASSNYPERDKRGREVSDSVGGSSTHVLKVGHVGAGARKLDDSGAGHGSSSQTSSWSPSRRRAPCAAPLHGTAGRWLLGCRPTETGHGPSESAAEGGASGRCRPPGRLGQSRPGNQWSSPPHPSSPPMDAITFLNGGGRGMWLSRWSRRRFTRKHSAGPPCEPSATYRSRTTPGNGFGSRGDSSASRAFILRTRVQR